MFGKVILSILVLTLVTIVVIFVVLPRKGAESDSQQNEYPHKNPSTPSVQGSHGNPINSNTPSNNDSAFAGPQSLSTTDNLAGKNISATAKELIDNLLTEKQPPVLEVLIEKIKKKDPQSAIEALIEKIKQTSGPERARYLMILGRFEDNNTLPLLTELCYDSDQGIKFTAISAIAGFGTEKSTVILLDMSNKAVEDFDKRMLEQMLTKGEPEKTIPNLMAALAHEDTGVVIKANEFLEKFSRLTHTVNPENRTSIADAKIFWQAWWEEYQQKKD